MKHLIKSISLKHIALIGVLALVGFVATYVTAWVGPTTAAPGGNVAAPINTGNTPQEKGTGNSNSANLTVRGGFVSTADSVAFRGIKAIGFEPNQGYVAAKKFCLSSDSTAILGYNGNPNNLTVNCISSWSDILNVANNSSVLPNGTATGQILGWHTNANPNGSAAWVPSTTWIKLTGGYGSGENPKVEIRGGTLSWPPLQETTLDVNGLIKISGGSPQPGKSLIAKPNVDHTLPINAGQAVWGDPSPAVSVNRRVSSTRYATIACNPGYIAVGGGGTCGSDPTDSNAPSTRSSNPTNFVAGGGSNNYGAFISNQFPNAWSIACTPGTSNSTVYVICMKTANY